MSTLRKIIGMAVLGAGGATLGALGGELLFLDVHSAPPSRSICLLFDVSGSMGEVVKDDRQFGRTQLQALQAAAKTFVLRQDLAADAVGLVTFASEARVLAAPGRDAGALLAALQRLQARGRTDLAGGLEAAARALQGAPGERWILLFSDGKPEGLPTDPDPERAALAAAARVRAQGIHIVAIGTGLADAALLAQVTGRPGHVFLSAPLRLDEGFERSDAFIHSRQMLSSQGSTETFRDSVVRASIWASLIAICSGLAMVRAQNRHLRRRGLTVRDLLLVGLGGVVTGAIAGAAGQSLFFVLSDVEQLGGAGRTAAWIVLGCGLGLGTSLFVPNLDRRRAGAGGIAAGIVAASVFLLAVPAEGDRFGRLTSAAALGAFTAIAVVLLEVVRRKAWLVVHWSAKESSTLRLGETPIVVGHSRAAHIRPAFAKDGATIAEIRFEDGEVRLDDLERGGRRRLRDGEVLQFGAIRVQVRVADAAAAATAPPAGAARAASIASPAREPQLREPARSQPMPAGSKREPEPREPASAAARPKPAKGSREWFAR